MMDLGDPILYSDLMLVGILNKTRIEAWNAEKGPNYYCPKCEMPVVLKKGRLVIHHFAHHKGSDCSWAVGETRDHMAAKKWLAEGLTRCGYSTDIEMVVPSLLGDRRADILVKTKNGRSAAIEVQHSPIDYGQLESRTSAYIAADIPVAWVGILSDKMKDDFVKKRVGGHVVRKFSPRPWQKWAHAYHMKKLWFIDPKNGELWVGELKPHLIEVQSTSWYGAGGEEMSAGGYTRRSKRWRDLHLRGPFEISDVELRCPFRNAWSGGQMNLPAGRRLQFYDPSEA